MSGVADIGTLGCPSRQQSTWGARLEGSGFGTGAAYLLTMRPRKAGPNFMTIIITDADAERLLSIPEAVEAMRLAFSDLADGRAVNPPRLRYSAPTPDPARRYTANIHAGAVASAEVAPTRRPER